MPEDRDSAVAYAYVRPRHVLLTMTAQCLACNVQRVQECLFDEPVHMMLLLRLRSGHARRNAVVAGLEAVVVTFAPAVGARHALPIDVGVDREVREARPCFERKVAR